MDQRSDRAILTSLWRLQLNANTVNHCFMQCPSTRVDRFRASAVAFSIVRFPPGPGTAQGRLRPVLDRDSCGLRVSRRQRRAYACRRSSVRTMARRPPMRDPMDEREFADFHADCVEVESAGVEPLS